MEDLISLIDWVVRKAIVAVILSIILMIIDFILKVIKLLEEQDGEQPFISIFYSRNFIE